MNTNETIYSFGRLVATVAITATAGTAMAQTGPADNCAPKMSSLQQRLYNKSGEGPDALRDFILIRRGIYQLDMAEVRDWAMSVEAARATCMKTGSASGTAATPVKIAGSR